MTLIRLKGAAATYFPGTSITAQTLRGEARKGRLEIVQIGICPQHHRECHA